MLSLYFQVELGKDPNFHKMSKKLTFYLWAFGSGLVCVCVCVLGVFVGASTCFDLHNSPCAG